MRWEKETRRKFYQLEIVLFFWFFKLTFEIFFFGFSEQVGSTRSKCCLLVTKSDK